jgi:hypothetical protein
MSLDALDQGPVRRQERFPQSPHICLVSGSHHGPVQGQQAAFILLPLSYRRGLQPETGISMDRSHELEISFHSESKISHFSTEQLIDAGRFK